MSDYNLDIQEKIQDLEEKLRLSIIKSDIKFLEEILSEDLIFINHLGNRITKEQDLLSHSSKELVINELIYSNQKIISLGETTVTVTDCFLNAKYNQIDVSGDFCYTRIWKKIKGDWKIIVAHCCKIVKV